MKTKMESNGLMWWVVGLSSIILYLYSLIIY